MTRSALRRTPRLRDDDGFTLAEMIVVGIITTIILLAVGGMYISTLRTQKVVTDLTRTSNGAQLVARSIDHGVRNGVIVKPLASGADGGQLLVVCTASSDWSSNSYAWQAWYYSPSGDGQIRTKTFASNAAPAAPTAAQLATWSGLIDGVVPGIPVGSPTKVFDIPVAGSVSLAFTSKASATSTDSTSIALTSNLAPHPTYAPGSEPCT